jgi:Tol biopolymer transport system component
MALAIGARLGSYEIVAPLGAGGMGEVYRARDTRLGREVAVKILPDAFSRDDDRLRRFQLEARAAGQLNHPHIIAVHDVGAHDGSPYIVSELLEGEDLRHRLAGRPLPVRRAVEYGIQIASGLAAAHEKGIVHRDLKPENIFVTRDGNLKILDFGVAKLTHGELHGDDVTTESTRLGVVIGTPGYMSPEQAGGLPIDTRSDIFSLGTILYEMLSGRAPFRRATTPDTIHAILQEEPPDLPDPEAVPPALDRLVRHCLEKEPRARFQNAHDLSLALGTVLLTSSPSKTGGRRRWKTAMLAGAAGLAAVAAIGLLAWSIAAPDRPPPNARVTRLTDLPGLEEFPAISPDGKAVAFSADVGDKRQIFVRLLAGGAPLQITRDDALDHQVPRWTRDSSSIVYFTPAAPGESHGAIWEVSALGGVPRRVTSSLGAADVSLADGRLAFFRLAGKSIQLVTATMDVSSPEVVAEFAPATYYLYPRWSPNGEWIAFQRGDSVRFDLFGVRADGGEPRQLTRENSMIDGFGWLPDSTGIIYSSSRGNPMPYLSTLGLWHLRLEDGSVRHVASGETSYVHPDIARSGATVVGRMRLETDIWKFPVEGLPEENTRRGIRVTNQTGQVLTPTPGPGDKEVAFLSDSGGHANLWVIDAGSGVVRQITHERDPNVAIGVPVWSPDGGSIAFVSSRGNPGFTFGVWLVNPDGSNLRNVVNPGVGPAWSLDGRWLYYSTRSGAAATDVVLRKVSPGGGAAVTVTTERVRNVIGSDGSTLYYVVERPFVDGTPEIEIRAATPENAPARVLARISASRVPIWQIVNPALSPDGKWLAQALTDGFTTNIWALSTSTGEWRQITDFGHRPTFIARRVSWSSDGRFILAALGEGDADIVRLDGLLDGSRE